MMKISSRIKQCARQDAAPTEAVYTRLDARVQDVVPHAAQDAPPTEVVYTGQDATHTRPEVFARQDAAPTSIISKIP